MKKLPKKLLHEQEEVNYPSPFADYDSSAYTPWVEQYSTISHWMFKSANEIEAITAADDPDGNLLTNFGGPQCPDGVKYLDEQGNPFAAFEGAGAMYPDFPLKCMFWTRAQTTGVAVTGQEGGWGGCIDINDDPANASIFGIWNQGQIGGLVGEGYSYNDVLEFTGCSGQLGGWLGSDLGDCIHEALQPEGFPTTSFWGGNAIYCTNIYEDIDDGDDTDGWACQAPPGGAPESATCLEIPGGDFATLEECEAAGCGSTEEDLCEFFNSISAEGQEQACDISNNPETYLFSPDNIAGYDQVTIDGILGITNNGECCPEIEDRHNCSAQGICVPNPDGEFISLGACQEAGCASEDGLNIGDWICKDPVNFPDCQQIANENQLQLATSYGFSPSTLPLTGEEFGSYSTQQDCIIYSPCTGTGSLATGSLATGSVNTGSAEYGYGYGGSLGPQGMPEYPRTTITRDVRRMQELAGIKYKKRKLL